MIFFAYITLAAGVAFFLWQKTRDWSKSSLQRLHLPPGEQNFLTRGKDGYFDQQKSYIVNGIIIAVFTLAAILTPWEYSPFLVGGMFFAFGLYVKDGIRKDIDRLEKNKTRQIAILTLLRTDPEGGHVPDPTLRGFGKSLVWVSGTFYDFHVKPEVPLVNGDVWSAERFQDQERAHEIIKKKLVALSNRPESDWFREDRSELV